MFHQTSNIFTSINMLSMFILQQIRARVVFQPHTYSCKSTLSLCSCMPPVTRKAHPLPIQGAYTKARCMFPQQRYPRMEAMHANWLKHAAQCSAHLPRSKMRHADTRREAVLVYEEDEKQLSCTTASVGCTSHE